MEEKRRQAAALPNEWRPGDTGAPLLKTKLNVDESLNADER